MITFADQTESSVVGRVTQRLLSGLSQLTSKLMNSGGMRLERTANLSLCPSQCECDKHKLLMLPDYSNRKGKMKKGPPVAKSKQAKSKHHMNTLRQYSWAPKTIKVMGVEEFNKFIFTPVRSKDGNLMPDMIHLDGWYVARTRPRNKKYRWSIVMPDGKGGRTILRHNQSQRPMRFSTPANAIIACEKAALKHRAYHAVIL
jgi:hypothetical protein